MSAADSEKLGLGPMVAMVVGSMVGAGIFALPQNIARSAGPGAALIGWAISGIGMLMLAFVFQTLANRKPELDAGIYSYAKEGFGHYIGFSSAWGFWVSSMLGNVSYFVLIFSGLGHFFPDLFGEGNTLAAFIGSSIVLWAVHIMILRGIREAAVINYIVTIAKIVPILMFVVLTAVNFNMGLFKAEFWGAPELGTIKDQFRGMMLITVWVFIGIEGASMYSGRARKRSDVGKATVLGFLGVLGLLVMVNMLSMGIMTQAELANMPNPSMAHVLERAVGPWGATLIIVGMIISVLGAFLAWVLLSAEVIYTAAGDRTMPRFLSKQNANNVPVNALWLSNLTVQLFLVMTLFSASTYTSLVVLAASMGLLPYLFSAAYGFMLSLRGETYAGQAAERNKDLLITGVATLYTLWLVYAGGLGHLLLSMLLYAPGIVLFALAKRENKQPVFIGFERFISAMVVIAALVAASGLYSGYLSL